MDNNLLLGFVGETMANFKLVEACLNTQNKTIKKQQLQISKLKRRAVVTDIVFIVIFSAACTAIGNLQEQIVGLTTLVIEKDKKQEASK